MQKYLLTWVTFNSRTSERMIEFKAEGKDTVILNEASRLLIAEAMAEKISKMEYQVYALNVLDDHAHCIVASDYPGLSEIMKNLKGYAAYFHNRNIKASKVDSSNQVNKIWARGFNRRLIKTDVYLANAIRYVEENHKKHGLSSLASSGCNPQLKSIMVGTGGRHTLD